jgi:hypothetical protein
MSRNRKSIQRGGTEGATIRNVVRTLLLNGYAIDSFARPATGASLLRVRKRDALGAEARTALLFSQTVSLGLRRRLTGEAQQHGATALLVLTRGVPTAGAPSIREISLSEFYNILGGEVRTDRILVPNLSNIMSELGHNRLPPSFSGKPDDLLEIYCEECLEFLLECPVRRYGQERRFEPLPDGLALGRNKFNLYFDAKAYGSEFHPTADDIRRFASYVKDFNLRYSSYVGPISLFVVISGSFSRDKNAIDDKISEFQTECATPMAFIRALDLANLVSECANSIQNRAAINWRRVFAAQIFDVKRFRDELNRIRKDSVIR